MFPLRHAGFGGAVLLVLGAGLAAAAEPLDLTGDPPRGSVPTVREPRALSAYPWRGAGRAEPVPVPAELERIAVCESGGDPRAIGGGGAYRGKYQFTLESWRALGGNGDPAAAPEAEQDRRALWLYKRSGAASWPGCAG